MAKVKRGVFRDFVRKNMHLTNEEIAKAAQAEGLPIDVRKVISHRYHITHPRPSTKQTKPKKRSRPPGKKTNGADNPNATKESALRKLIFELGFDAARRVFEEFESLHRGMHS